MLEDTASIPGFLFVAVLCAWAVWFLSAQLMATSHSGKAVDTTLSEIDRADAPGMYSLQILGIVLLVGASAATGIGAIVGLILQLAGRT